MQSPILHSMMGMQMEQMPSSNSNVPTSGFALPAPQEETTYQDEPELGIRTESRNGNQSFRTSWTMQARRISGNEVTAVSPQFLIDDVPFKLTLQPYFSEEHKRPGSKKGKGQACFRASGGKCVIQLKCERRNGPKVRCRFFVEDAETRGPFLHDFADRMLAGLSKEDEQWSLNKFVKKGGMTLTIGVDYEIMPRTADYS